MNRKSAPALLLGLVAATGIWLLKISTPFGLGLIDDAISYIAAARALLSGLGFTRIWLATALEPITHWPPGFPATLAVISFVLKIDPYRSARILNMLVFGGNAALLALLGYKMTKSYLRGIILSVLFLANSAFLRLHAQALSEPLYIFISLLAFWAFFHYFENVIAGKATQLPSFRREKYFLLAGFLSALAYLIRYAALSLLATFIVAILVLIPTWRKRFISLSYFLFGALPLILIWMGRNKLLGGSATNRFIEWHPVTLENSQRGLAEFFSFLFPLRELRNNWIENYSLLGIILSIFSLVLLSWFLWRGLKYFFKPGENQQPEIIPFTTALYIFGYMGSLLVSLTFFDAATPLNDRILSPVYVAVLIVSVYFAHKLFMQGKIASKIVSGSMALFFLVSFTVAQVDTVQVLQESPTGFASWRWRESTVMETIRNLPEETAIYTNQAPAVYFWTDRPAMMIWSVEQVQADLQSDDAVLAFFFPENDDSPEFKTYFRALAKGLVPIVRSGLGNLYEKP